MMNIFPDSGATICLGDPQLIAKVNLDMKDLIPYLTILTCVKQVSTVRGTKLLCKNWVLIKFQVTGWTDFILVKQVAWNLICFTQKHSNQQWQWAMSNHHWLHSYWSKNYYQCHYHYHYQCHYQYHYLYQHHCHYQYQ